MPLEITLQPSSDETLSEQIIRQIEMAILLGDLRKGEALPSVRVLAVELKVNPNTIAKTFQILVQRGSLVSQKGRGYFVAAEGSKYSDAEKNRQLRLAAEQFAASTRALNLPSEVLIKAVSSLLATEESDDGQ